MIYDVIILGGGIAGLYTAYKLNRRSPHLKILLLEKENYLGGRVFTVHQGNMNVEAGAGRFADNHRYLMELLKELKLTSKMVKNGSEVAYAPANGTGVGSGMGSSEAMNPTTNSSGDLRSPEEFDKETRFCSATTSNIIFEENIPKNNNNIWSIIRTNIVSLSKQIFQVIYNRVITRNSEKYLDILNIRSPSWELYARKNKPLRIPSRCSNDNFKNYVAV